MRRRLQRASPSAGALRWTRFAWVLLVVCTGLSLAAAVAWRAQARNQEETSFRDEAAGVGAAVTTALLRMNDLTVAARAKIASDPELSNAELGLWYDSTSARTRYRGALGFGYLDLVPAAQLPAHVAAVTRDPVPGLGAPAHPFKLVPPGRRPSYCLIRMGVAAPLNQIIPGGYGLDVCKIPGAGDFLRSRDSGQFTTLAGTLAQTGERVLIVSAPVYRGGVVPQTVATRRTQMLGWVVGVFDVKTVLGDAVKGHHGLAVEIKRSPTTLEPGPDKLASIASVGNKPAPSWFTRRFVLDADGHWIVTVSKAPTWTVFSPGVQGLIVFVAGVLVSGLLFLLVRVLSTGRARALRLVAQKTDQLRHLALHDSLTDLPNRGLILDRAQQALVRARREHTNAAAMFIDLDNFKNVNDTFGHQVGDELLQAVAARISAVLREVDTVGRQGGDEFVVIVEGGPLPNNPELVAERLLHVLREPYELEGAADTPLTVTASIGVAKGDRASADDLLRDADIALYEAKAAGRNCSITFLEEMHVAVHDRLALEADLRLALELDQLFLVYQPMFDLADGAVSGLEALIRWQHPSRGVVMPSDFIHVAEESGIILELGRWALETACSQGAAWHALGHDVSISVNVSACQLAEPGFQTTVAAALAASGFEPGRLILEITETVLMQDTERTAIRLAALKEIGVRLAIDDFGTGYSSLAYLQQFPVDAIKIDQTFISGIARSREAKALIHTFVQLGKTLGLETVAEGIEDDAQLHHLREEHCVSGQGYLLARPLAAADVGFFLSHSRAA